jgi:hypothetical protein
LTPWGNTPSIWLGISNFFVVASMLVVPAGLIMSVLSYVLHLGRVAAFLSVFVTVMFASIWLMYHTQRGLRLSTLPTLTFYGFLIGGISGLVAALTYSEPAVVAANVVPVGVDGGAGNLYPAVPARPVRL